MRLRNGLIALTLALPAGALAQTQPQDQQGQQGQQGQQQQQAGSPSQMQPSGGGDESLLIKPPPDAKLIGTSQLDEIRTFPEMGQQGNASQPQAAKIVNIKGVDRLFKSDRSFTDAVSYFDQQFKSGGYQISARVETPSAVAWTVKRPDGTVADAVVRNTKPTTIELAEVGTTAMRVQPAQ